MTVNRNNYEECFLLYADNELSKTERKIVEIFVQENPDLKEEFSMMKLTINLPDEKIKLFDKSFLLKEELPVINESNYEEIFVLYHDGELSGEQKSKTEDFIAENPKVKTEFELIGKTRFIPENSVVYPGKKKLYRKEKSGKVIPIMFWRSIAAAVLIGFGLWITIPLLNKRQVSAPVATTVNSSPQKTDKKQIKPDTNIISEKPVKEGSDIASSTETTKPEKIEQNKKETEKPILQDQKVKKELVAVNETKIKKEPVEEKLIVLKPNADNQLTVPDEQPGELTDIVKKAETTIAINDQPIPKNQNKTPNPQVAHVQTVSYIADADVNHQNYVFYDVTADDFKKSKVGGFLKKVRRVVERSNPITRLITESDLVAK
ncbi:MAG TPA: hypothetical protein VIJ75_19215 [Hanamia sp.]